MPRLLTTHGISKGLAGLDGSRVRRALISKTFGFDEFPDGIAFVDAVAGVAERQEHHPDIHIRYTTVTLSLQTHSEGGVTAWDISLAKAIDGMRRSPSKP